MNYVEAAELEQNAAIRAATILAAISLGGVLVCATLAAPIMQTAVTESGQVAGKALQGLLAAALMFTFSATVEVIRLLRISEAAAAIAKARFIVQRAGIDPLQLDVAPSLSISAWRLGIEGASSVFLMMAGILSIQSVFMRVSEAEGAEYFRYIAVFFFFVGIFSFVLALIKWAIVTVAAKSLRRKAEEMAASAKDGRSASGA